MVVWKYIRKNEEVFLKISFTVYGRPIGKQRPRITRGGKLNFLPSKSRKYSDAVKYDYMDQIKGNTSFPDKTPVYGRIKIYFEDSRRPDCNNVERAIADALEGFAYKNDKNFCCYIKDYGFSPSNPRVEIDLSDSKRELLKHEVVSMESKNEN